MSQHPLCCVFATSLATFGAQKVVGELFALCNIYYDRAANSKHLSTGCLVAWFTLLPRIVQLSVSDHFLYGAHSILYMCTRLRLIDKVKAMAEWLGG